MIKPNPGCVVVGVAYWQADVVTEQAAVLAEKLNVQLVCATANTSLYPDIEHPDGTVRGAPYDPDIGGPRELTYDPELHEKLTKILQTTSVEWTVRALAGDPAQALGRLAEILDASMIVVGTRKRGIVRTVHDFFAGSVAAHLAHRQHRPVVVIPIDPVGFEGSLPWESQP